MISPGGGGLRCRRSRARVPALLLGASALVAPAVILLAARISPAPAWWRSPLGSAAQPSLVRVLDREGNLLARVRNGSPAILPVRFDEVDPLLARATVAAEDRRFWSHRGIDLPAVARAAGQNLRAGRRVSGGSTLTQQTVKLARRGLTAGAPRSLAVKVREAWWSLVIEARTSKREILERYWNLADYGSDVRGVGAAAQLYFGHGAESLTLEEAALLAALPQSPVRTDPRRDRDAARRARDRVLARMGLTPAEEAAARERPVRLYDGAGLSSSARAPHWIAGVTRRAPQAVEIRLPIDARLQSTAAAALQTTLRALHERGADAGAIVALHNPSGEVRAWVGSADWGDPGHGQFDAACARRQPGSALKPFTYALAFEEGLRPAHVVPDLPLEYEGSDGAFRPRNYSGSYHGPVRARLALANSWNAPAVALLSRLGPVRLLDRLRAAGLHCLERPAEQYGLGLTLGGGEVSLMELTTAYACLARGGVRVERVEVLEIRDASGRSLPVSMAAEDSARTEPARTFDAAAAFFVLSILSDESARARAFGESGPFAFPFPVAIKTGTSSDWRDNWAFGCTPDWTVGVWIGQAGGTPMDRVSGTQGAILALREILAFLHEERDFGRASNFLPPSGLERRWICTRSGEPPGPHCPESVEEWFLATDPHDPPCRWHRSLGLDIATGLEGAPDAPAGRIRRALFTIPPARCGVAPFDWPGALYAAWGRTNGWPDPPLAEMDDASGLRADDGAGTSPQRASGDPILFAVRPGADLRILRPADGAVYAIDASLPAGQQAVALEGACATGALRWFVDGTAVGVSREGEPIFWPLAPGRHIIRAVAADRQDGFRRGNSDHRPYRDAPAFDEVHIEVEPAS